MEHAPRHYYDCENCKFNWSCGYTCDCSLTVTSKNIIGVPLEVRVKVNNARAEVGLYPRFPHILAVVEMCSDKVKAMIMQRKLEESGGR